jgi:hypothetical protein
MRPICKFISAFYQANRRCHFSASEKACWEIPEHTTRLAPLFSRRDGIDVDIGGPFAITVYSTISSYPHDLAKSQLDLAPVL